MKRAAVKSTGTVKTNSGGQKQVNKKVVTRTREQQNKIDAKKRAAVNRKRDVRYRSKS